jgi:ATP-dependent protease ClpP protease subunit
MAIKKFRLFGTIISEEAYRWGSDDVTPSQIESFLRNCADEDEIEIEMNSPGGSVLAGIAIANLFKNAKQKVTCTIYGMAASMGSVIACAADEVKAFKSAFMMIHNPWTMAIGDSNEMRKVADTLDTFRDAIIGFYLSKFDGKTREDLIALMDAETWIMGSDFGGIPIKATILDDPSIDGMAACVSRVGFDKAPEAAKNFFKVQASKDIVAPPPAPPPPPPAPPPPPPEEPSNSVARLSATLEAKDKQCRDFQSQRDQARAELAKANDSIAKMKTDFEAASAVSKKQVGELEARIERMTLNAFGTEQAEGVATTWEQALELCGGDYAKARVKYDELYQAYMKKSSQK